MPLDSHADSRLNELETLLPDVSRETFERLLAFEALFLKWSKAFNLAAPSTHSNFWRRHILDSARIAAIRKPADKWVDIGSGGGLPGIVLAILMRQTGDGVVHLVESNGKKAAFLRQALLETQAAGQVHALRIEDAHAIVGNANVITARALAPLPELIAYARPWLEGGATGLFHKGRDYREELKAARDVWRFDLVEHASGIDPASVILEIHSLSPVSGA